MIPVCVSTAQDDSGEARTEVAAATFEGPEEVLVCGSTGSSSAAICKYKLLVY
jgi:hypothetical protein